MYPHSVTIIMKETKYTLRTVDMDAAFVVMGTGF